MTLQRITPNARIDGLLYWKALLWWVWLVSPGACLIHPLIIDALSILIIIVDSGGGAAQQVFDFTPLQNLHEVATSNWRDHGTNYHGL